MASLLHREKVGPFLERQAVIDVSISWEDYLRLPGVVVPAAKALALATGTVRVESHAALKALLRALFFEARNSTEKRLQEQVAVLVQQSLPKLWTADKFRDAELVHLPSLQFAPALVQADRNFVLAVAKVNGQALQHAAQELRADRSFVFQVVTRNFRALEFAAQELREDPSFAIKVLRQTHGAALHCCSKELQSDHKLVLLSQLLRGRPTAVAWEEWADRDMVLELVSECARALWYAAPELRADRAFVLEAFRRNSSALSYAPEELRADRAFVLEAARQHGSSLGGVDYELRKDRSFVLDAVRQNGEALEHAAEELRADREIVLEAVRRHPPALKYAAKELRRDRDLVLEAVRQAGRALVYAAEELRADRDIALEAVRQDRSVFYLVAAHLQKDCHFLRLVYEDQLMGPPRRLS